MKALLERYSVKKYKDKNIDKSLIDEMIKIVNSSPTSINGHHFSALFIDNKNIKKELSKIGNFGSHVDQAPLFVVFNLDLNAIKETLKITNQKIDEKIVDYVIITSIVDATISATMLQDYCLLNDLGTCFIGSVRHNVSKVREILNYPSNVFPIVGLTIGYSDQEKTIKPKLNKVMFNQYDKNHFTNIIKDYDNELKEFYIKKGKQPIGHIDWISNAYKNDSKFIQDIEVDQMTKMLSKYFFKKYLNDENK